MNNFCFVCNLIVYAALVILLVPMMLVEILYWGHRIKYDAKMQVLFQENPRRAAWLMIKSTRFLVRVGNYLGVMDVNEGDFSKGDGEE